jgi:hypothetical protein
MDIIIHTAGRQEGLAAGCECDSCVAVRQGENLFLGWRALADVEDKNVLLGVRGYEVPRTIVQVIVARGED